MIPDKHMESQSPCLFGRDGKLLRNIDKIESFMSSDEELLDEDEADLSLLPQSVKLFCFLLHQLQKKFNL